jgi:hypothetical protein
MHTMRKWHRKAWTRAELEELLGPPDWEGNGASRVEYRGDAVHVYSTVVGKHAVPPPPIEGVDRWIAWDCSKVEPLDAATKNKIEHLQRGTAGQDLTQEETDSLVRKVKEYFDRTSDRCSATTRIKLGEALDAWFMFRVCSRHGELDD